MSMKPFKKLTSREDALDTLLSNIHPVNRFEEIPLENADGRVLMDDVYAGFDVPPFDRAAMDGYAVIAEETSGASNDKPINLKLIGTQHTGELFEEELKIGTCVEISTGAPLPDGSDAVVMVEHTERNGEIIRIFKQAKPMDNIAPAGEDMKKGQRVLMEGDHLNPGKIGALAALGYEKVKVLEKPRVAIYSSGPEIVPQGQPLKPGQIYDINSYTLSSVIRQEGGVPVKRGIVHDDEASVMNAVNDASQFDIGVFSGGSSVGSRDLLGEVIQELGEVLFHGIRVKPGKPTLFGIVKGTPILGMPGYPTSCLINSYILLSPALRKLARLPELSPRKMVLPMGHKIESKSDREQFISIRVTDGKAYRVYKQSGNITSMTHADGFILLPIGKSIVEEGEQVQVTLLKE